MSTATPADARWTALRNQGFTGSTSDMLLQWLQANGATSDQINTAWAEMLFVQLGDFTQINDSWYALLGSLGYTQGHINDREYAFWLAGGAFTTGPPNWHTVVPDLVYYENDLPALFDLKPYVSANPPIVSWASTYGLIIDDGVLLINDVPGIYPETIKAFNTEGNADSNSFNIEIKLDSRPTVPVWQSVPNLTIAEGSGLTRDLTPFVLSQGSVTYSRVSGVGTISADGVYTMAATQAVGVYTVVMRATNSAGSSDYTVYYYVSNDSYAYLHDFTTAALGGYDFKRAGGASTNTSVGGARHFSGDNEPVFPGGNRISGEWTPDEVCYGLQIDPAGENVVPATPTFTPVGGDLVSGLVLGDGIDGVGLESSGGTSQHNLSIAVPLVPGGSNYTLSGYIRRGDVRYVSIAATIAGFNDIWVIVDTKTWLATEYGGTASDPQKNYGAVVSPGQDGEHARVIILAQNNTGADRAVNVYCSGCSAPTGGWNQSYDGVINEPVFQWYGQYIELGFDPSSYLPPGATRGNSYADLTIPPEPGLRVNDLSFHVVFRSPVAGSTTGTNNRIWYMTSGGTGNSIVIKEAGSSLIYVNLVVDDVVVSQEQISVANRGQGDVLDIRGLKNRDGFLVLSKLSSQPDWVEHFDTSADAQQDLAAGITNSRIGEQDGFSHGSAQIDMVLVRFGFAAHDEAAVRAWPEWQEPLPVITLQPTDQEVAA